MSLPPEDIERIVAEEISSLPDIFKSKKKDYICYCLRSSAARARTYFGTTCDLVHRIRQHNGLIVGGARATSTTRPWRVAAVVYGFSDRSVALRYEWFCKQKHSKKAYYDALHGGANSIERRAALMAEAARKCPKEKLQFYFGDPYMEQCCMSSSDKTATRETPKEQNVCYVSF